MTSLRPENVVSSAPTAADACMASIRESFTDSVLAQQRTSRNCDPAVTFTVPTPTIVVSAASNRSPNPVSSASVFHRVVNLISPSKCLARLSAMARSHNTRRSLNKQANNATSQGQEVPKTNRIIKANNPSQNAQFNYANNRIKTAKYNIFTFLPRNLYEQFHRVANIYFLVLLILQFCPAMTSLSPVTTILPLIFVLTMSAIKDAYDDYQRHKNDHRVNNRRCLLVRDGKLVEEVWKNVVVGDIIKLECDDFVTADCLILSTSEPFNLCFVETKELDGETNLKVRNGLSETAGLNNEDLLSQFDGEIDCEIPNNNLNRFDGVLIWRSLQYRLTNDNLLLRGCMVRNTKSIFCLVVFAGRDTKLVRNSGKTKLKRTNIDIMLDRQILAIFILLLILCFFLTLGTFVPFLTADEQFEASFIPSTSGSLFSAFVRYFSYLILLNTLVPISLVVTVEIFRFINSQWINSDLKMYYAPKDQAANANTTTLSEQLGQIEYVFSDKTGTLTQNVMTFNKCSIDGVCYGPCSVDGRPVEVTDSNRDRLKISFAWNPSAEPSFYWFDQRLVDAVSSGKQAVIDFFRALAVCHTVMSDTKNGDLVYQAQSPDEGALVSAARNFGFVYKCRSPESVVIEVNGSSEAYELISIIDFNSERKRMSVIVQHRGRIFILSKGADSVMFQRLAPGQDDLKYKIQQHLDSFALSGLRTLVICRREFEFEFFKGWVERLRSANAVVDGDVRQRALDTVYDEVEREYVLLGATAIEDKLQQGVPETLHKLTTAGIRVWVLTGDKLETAVNIGFSCNLLTQSMQDFVIDAATPFEVANRLKEIRHEIDKFVPGQTPIRSYISSGHLMSMSSSMTSFVASSPSVLSGRDSGAPSPMPYQKFGGFALVISGAALDHALSGSMEDDFLAIAMKCTTVICCRVTPLQKSMIVDVAKRRFSVTTLAIGDGANDVGMIKTAHIGVGISGQEGMQAVYASDYSIAQFRYLQRLLFVHGRWSYRRICAFLNFFFFKNFSFTILHLFFSFLCGFTAQPVLSEEFITVYNLFLTSWPVLILSCFEQDVNDFYSVALPRLYEPGKRNALFNWRAFLFSVLDGTFCAFVIMMTIFLGLASNSPIADLQSVAIAADTILMLLVTFRIAMVTNYWTGLHHFFTWGSLALFFAMTAFVHSPMFFDNNPDLPAFKFVHVFINVWISPLFWLLAIVAISICTLPMFAIKFFFWRIRPTLSVRARILQQEVRDKEFPTAMPRPPSAASSMLLQPPTAFSPRPRFPTAPSSAGGISRHRSSFAFSQSEGYGRLITTGRLVQSWLVPGARESLRLARKYSSVRQQLGGGNDQVPALQYRPRIQAGPALFAGGAANNRYPVYQRTFDKPVGTPVTEQADSELQSMRHSCEALASNDGDSQAEEQKETKPVPPMYISSSTSTVSSSNAREGQLPQLALGGTVRPQQITMAISEPASSSRSSVPPSTARSSKEEKSDEDVFGTRL